MQCPCVRRLTAPWTQRQIFISIVVACWVFNVHRVGPLSNIPQFKVQSSGRFKFCANQIRVRIKFNSIWTFLESRTPNDLPTDRTPSLLRNISFHSAHLWFGRRIYLLFNLLYTCEAVTLDFRFQHFREQQQVRRQSLEKRTGHGEPESALSNAENCV